MIGGLIASITCIIVTCIICITVNIMDKRKHAKDVYYTVNNRLRDLIDEIERIRDNKLKLDISILLANLKDIKRL